MRKWLVVWVVLAPSGALASGDTKGQSELERAYREELAQLESERQAMKRELEGLREQTTAMKAQKQAEIERLGNTLMAIRVQADDLEAELERVDRREELQSSHQQLLESTLDQAVETLGRHGMSVSDKEAAPDVLLGEVFRRGAALVQQWSSTRAEEGTYFTTDGREQSGTVLRIGRIAALAAGPGEGGTLAPAGGGNLKVVDPGGLALAKEAVENGKVSGILPVFLFDPLVRSKTAGAKQDILQHLESGGIIVWPIVALGLLAFLITLERIYTLRRVHRNVDRLTGRVFDAIKNGDWDGAVEHCRRRPGAVSRVLLTALKNRRLERTVFEDAVNEAIIAELPRLERFLSALRVVAAVAPLLGLLGTVTGMISTFDVITVHGTGDPKLLSGGISEALVTTEVGLIVAIPVLLIHAVLSSAVDHITGDMERNALGISRAIYGNHRATGEGTSDMTAAKRNVAFQEG